MVTAICNTSTSTRYHCVYEAAATAEDTFWILNASTVFVVCLIDIILVGMSLDWVIGLAQAGTGSTDGVVSQRLPSECIGSSHWRGRLIDELSGHDATGSTGAGIRQVITVWILVGRYWLGVNGWISVHLSSFRILIGSTLHFHFSTYHFVFVGNDDAAVFVGLVGVLGTPSVGTLNHNGTPTNASIWTRVWK